MMRAFGADDPNLNSGFIDKWSLVHSLSGLAVGFLGIRPMIALPGALAYEVAEYAHEWPRGSVIFGSKEPETWQNITGDLTLYTVLYYAARSIKNKPHSQKLGLAAAVAALGLAMHFSPGRLDPPPVVPAPPAPPQP